MKQRVSRRNRRTASTQARHARDLAILAIPLVIFIGGFASLAGALHSQPTQTAESARPPTQQSTSQPNPYTGIIMPSVSQDVPVAPDEPEREQPAQNVTTQGEAPAIVPDETENDDVEVDVPAPATPTPAPAPSPPSMNVQQGYIVHHTAYREQPVYRTVHHQASTAREVTVAGKTHVEWTSCPVCGQRHASPYNERVLDHVTPVPCTACGGAHDADYDETVYE